MTWHPCYCVGGPGFNLAMNQGGHVSYVGATPPSTPTTVLYIPIQSPLQGPLATFHPQIFIHPHLWTALWHSTSRTPGTHRAPAHYRVHPSFILQSPRLNEGLPFLSIASFLPPFLPALAERERERERTTSMCGVSTRWSPRNLSIPLSQLAAKSPRAYNFIALHFLPSIFWVLALRGVCGCFASSSGCNLCALALSGTWEGFC